ncbi:hypothetical protein [Enterococcus sp. HMSC072H05]|uniref:hypothetical protein n=1 Tax=Enterococcus sp. HMSC072H05 TaxID=1715012 RepID=UPI0008A32EBC|nr:hypothetical protein [Enterococcus sp. HMSC072H05]OFL87294.1 hypothetical protein HMPREF2742_17040 [Enterococcus sp. HMSC072H05]
MRRKTSEQQKAWSELLILTADPDWYKDEDKCARHNLLMAIVDPFNHLPDRELTVDEKKQRYLDMRPGLEASIVSMIKDKKTNAQIHKAHKVNSNVFAYLRRKHGLGGKKRTKKTD